MTIENIERYYKGRHEFLKVLQENISLLVHESPVYVKAVQELTNESFADMVAFCTLDTSAEDYVRSFFDMHMENYGRYGQETLFDGIIAERILSVLAATKRQLPSPKSVGESDYKRYLERLQKISDRKVPTQLAHGVIKSNTEYLQACMKVLEHKKSSFAETKRIHAAVTGGDIGEAMKAIKELSYPFRHDMIRDSGKTPAERPTADAAT